MAARPGPERWSSSSRSLSYASWVSQIACDEFSDIRKSYQETPDRRPPSGQAWLSPRRAAAYAGRDGPPQGGHADGDVYPALSAGGHRHRPLADQPEILSLGYQPAGCHHRGIRTINANLHLDLGVAPHLHGF